MDDRILNQEKEKLLQELSALLCKATVEELKEIKAFIENYI